MVGRGHNEPLTTDQIVSAIQLVVNAKELSPDKQKVCNLTIDRDIPDDQALAYEARYIEITTAFEAINFPWSVLPVVRKTGNNASKLSIFLVHAE